MLGPLRRQGVFYSDPVNDLGHVMVPETWGAMAADAALLLA